MLITLISTEQLSHYLQEICYLDSAGDIILDADGGDVFFKDAGTTFGSATNTSGNLIIKSGTTTALTFSGANATLAGTLGVGAVTSTGIVTGTAFTAGSAVLAEAELELLDGLTAGTAIASKVVTTDANIDTTGQRNLTISGELDAATGDFSGDVDIDGTLEADAITVNGTALASVIAGTTVNLATLASTVTITDNESTDENNAVIFTAGGDVDGGSLGLESDGNLTYNPSSGTLNVPNISVTGTQTIVNSVTMNASNAVIFEGATADAHETTLSTVDATADRTINLPNQSGTLPVLAAASATAITSTPEELNILDGATVVVGEINALDIGSTAVGTAVASKAVILDGNKDYTGIRNLTITGELDAATLDISGAIDIAGAVNIAAAVTQSGGVFTQDGGAVFNEGSADVDFRVESNGNSSMFFVDGGNNHVNINHAGDLGAVFNVQAANAAIDSAGIIAVGTNNAQAVNLGGQISLGGSAVDAATGFAQFGTIAGRKENGTSANYAGYLAFGTLSAGGTNTERMRISSTGVATFTSVVDITGTTDSSDATGDTGILRVEGGASIAKKLYIGTDLDVDGTANLDIVDIDGAVKWLQDGAQPTDTAKTILSEPSYC